MTLVNLLNYRPIPAHRSALNNLLAFSVGLLLATVLFVGPPKNPRVAYVHMDQNVDGNPVYDQENPAEEKVDLHGPHPFEDLDRHHDNDQVAQKLYSEIQVLCWVMTCQENHRTKADHVMATWGRRCNKLLFISDGNDTSLPVVLLDNVEKGRKHLTGKTMKAFQYIYENYLDEADWFLKADDDSYVILENLRYFLTSQDTSQPVYFGHHFKTIVKQGYFSGGGGYVLSKEALCRFGERSKSVNCSQDGGAEDAQFGKCMEKLGVRTGDSRDVLGRSRFHCFHVGNFISGNYPPWYYKYDKYGAQKGIQSVSDYPITFHYLKPEDMYKMEYYTYHLKAYGIQSADQDLNGRPPDNLITEEPEETTTNRKQNQSLKQDIKQKVNNSTPKELGDKIS